MLIKFKILLTDLLQNLRVEEGMMLFNIEKCLSLYIFLSPETTLSQLEVRS